MQYEIVGGQHQDSTYDIEFQTDSALSARQWVAQLMEQYPDWECKVTIQFILSDIFKLMVCDGTVTCRNVDVDSDRLETILAAFDVTKATGHGYGQCWDIHIVVK